MKRIHHIRSGYTLLEVTLALAIAILLLAAVYTSLYTTVMQTKLGREVVEDTNVARAVITRIANDINPQLKPLDTRLVRTPDNWMPQMQEVPAEPAAESTDQAATAGTGSSTEKTEEAEPEEEENNSPYFNLGVQGDTHFLRLYVSQAPGLQTLANKDPNSLPLEDLADLRRITYWIAQGTNGPLGLAREEIKISTSAEALMVDLPDDLPNPEDYILAPEVVEVTFRYFDPSMGDWVEFWDGTIPGDIEGKKPVGPPAAIEVILKIQRVGTTGESETDYKLHRQVVFLPTSNGANDLAAQAPMTEEP